MKSSGTFAKNRGLISGKAEFAPRQTPYFMLLIMMQLCHPEGDCGCLIIVFFYMNKIIFLWEAWNPGAQAQARELEHYAQLKVLYAHQSSQQST